MILKQLMEEVTPLDPDMDIDEQMGELEKRMAAARRGIGITNKMRAGPERTKHRSRVMGNLNSIRAQLNKVIKVYAQFEKAASDFESGGGRDPFKAKGAPSSRPEQAPREPVSSQRDPFGAKG